MTRKELESELEFTKKLLKSRSEEVDRLEKMIKGERVCGGYCANCIHRVPELTDPFWERVRFSCDLDCKCPDFQRK